MNAFKILEFLGELGARYSKRDLNKVSSYFQRMAIDGRIIIISHSGVPYALLAFSICDSYSRFFNKGTWEYRSHKPNGRICYVEKMACKKWTKDLRKRIEQDIVERYPRIEYAIWHRDHPHNDRRVIYRRKVYEPSL